MRYNLYYVKAKKTGKQKTLKTNIYIVRKDSDKALAERLGIIKFYSRWRQYVFYPDFYSIWSKDCLKKIASFLNELNLEWRNGLKRR